MCIHTRMLSPSINLSPSQHGSVWRYHCMYGCINAYMAVSMHVWLYQCMYGGITACMAVSMHVWLYQCMYGCISACMAVSLHVWLSVSGHYDHTCVSPLAAAQQILGDRLVGPDICLHAINSAIDVEYQYHLETVWLDQIYVCMPCSSAIDVEYQYQRLTLL